MIRKFLIAILLLSGLSAQELRAQFVPLPVIDAPLLSHSSGAALDQLARLTMQLQALRQQYETVKKQYDATKGQIDRLKTVAKAVREAASMENILDLAEEILSSARACLETVMSIAEIPDNVKKSFSQHVQESLDQQEQINEKFALVNKVGDDVHLSDYERLQLLFQAQREARALKKTMVGYSHIALSLKVEAEFIKSQESTTKKLKDFKPWLD